MFSNEKFYYYIVEFYLGSHIFKKTIIRSIVVNTILSLQEVKVFVEGAKLTKGQFEH